MLRLSRRVYQLVALALLLVFYGGVADLAWHDVLPFRVIAAMTGNVLAGLLLLLGATIAWVLAVLPLRAISDAPPMRPPSGTDFRSAYAKARADLERQRTSDDPRASRSYHLRMAGAGTLVGIACTLGVAANLELFPERIWITPVAFVIACALLVPYHALRALLA